MPTLIGWIRSSVPGITKFMVFFRFLKLAKLLRLMRILKIMDFLEKAEERMASRLISTAIGILRLASILVIFSHFVACVLWAIGLRFVGDGDSWVHKALPWSTNPNEEDVYYQYIASLYFAITIMSTVGFGDIVSALASERLMIMVVMMFATAMMGMLVSGIQSVFEKANAPKREKREKLLAATKFMNRHNVPIHLQVRVKHYLTRVLENEKHMNTQSFLFEAVSSSESLYAELNLATFGYCLTKHPILKLLPRDLLAGLAAICQTVLEPPGEVIQLPGRLPNRMLYLNSGSVGLSPEDILPGESGEAPLQFLKAMQTYAEVGPHAHIEDTSAVQIVYAGTFLDAFSLFDSDTVQDRMAITSTFCEFTALLTKDFNEFMKLRAPPDLDSVLLGYASFELDSPKQLQRALSSGLQMSSLSILGEDYLLHEAARRGATQCIKMLIDQEADVNAVDHNGFRALEYAAKAKHKASMEMLALHGAEASSMHMHDSSSGPRSIASRTTRTTILNYEYMEETKEEFECRIALSVDVFKFGHDGAKSIDDLYHEVQSRQCVLQFDDDGILKRYLSIVKVAIRAETKNGMRNLREIEDDRYVNDHATTLPLCKMDYGEDPVVAAKRLLVDKMELPDKWIEDHVQFDPEPSIFEEEKHSKAYPALTSVYLYYEVAASIVNPQEGCSKVGLPNGDAFKVVSKTGDSETARVYIWVQPT